MLCSDSSCREYERIPAFAGRPNVYIAEYEWIPAFAGSQNVHFAETAWIPAFAGIRASTGSFAAGTALDIAPQGLRQA